MSAKRKTARLFVWAVMIICVLILMQIIIQLRVWESTPNWFTDADNYQLPDVRILPDIATPLVIIDEKGRKKWTVSIPSGMELPLSPSKIDELCSQCVDISRNFSHSKTYAFDYHRQDENYMDVLDAQVSGLLPTPDLALQRVLGKGRGPICDSTLTFILQSEDAGLGKTLMDLWMSYGLAQKEGRTFFIDDTRWAYGKFSTYFKPPLEPSCLPPPPSQMVPCPRQARHLVVSSANAPWIFGASFRDYFELPHKNGSQRQKPIFNLLRSGYEALFILAADDAAQYENRVHDLHRDTRRHGGIQVGIHVRRGDVRPLEAPYRGSYLPLDRYANSATKFFKELLTTNNNHHIALERVMGSSKAILASDDPDIYSAPELQGTERAQSYICLASKSVLDAVSADRGHAKEPVDENIGWEGGFFKDMFWALGATRTDFVANGPSPSNRQSSIQRTSGANSPLHRFQPPEDALRLRELIGRAYLLDLAVLGQTDRVVCGVSSFSCRLLAVMMGWDRAVENNAWRNIDGSWHWLHSIPEN
jgi:hypothetical protein